MTELKEWLNSINTNKNNLIDEDSDLENSIHLILSIDVYLDI